ncbi:MAG: hypothetical protein J6Z34_02725 [Clostridia bacterium]|nr:hypothetical protein [Clostridia bacterium]
MKRSAVSAALDVFFVFFATAASVFTVMRYYFRNLSAAITAAAVSGVFVTVIFRMSAIRKNAVYALKKKDAEQMEVSLDALSLMDETALNAYFKRLLQKSETPFSEENGTIILTETGTELKYYFTFSETYAGRIIEFYKQAGTGRKILVIGRNFNEEIFALTARFAGRIVLLDGAHLYPAMKKYDCFPETKEPLTVKKTRKNLPKELFSKKRARQYFLYGLTMEFFSFFVFYPVYYLVFGTALVLLSVVCYFFGVKEAPPQENPFKN